MGAERFTEGFSRGEDYEINLCRIEGQLSIQHLSIQHREDVSVRRFCISLFLEGIIGAPAARIRCLVPLPSIFAIRVVSGPSLAKMHTFFSSATWAVYPRV
jgi:hypothetical protein